MSHEKLYYLGVKALVEDDQGRILMFETREGSRTYWDFPGGRVNEHETLHDALRREVREETGIDQIKEITLVGTEATTIEIPIELGGRAGLILALYRCSADLPDTLTLESNARVVWCDRENVVSKITQYPDDLRKKIGATLIEN